MHKILRFFAIFTLSVTTVACEHQTGKELTPDAAITAFSIGNFRVYTHDINVQGRDTLVYWTVTGSTVQFSIDQQRNIIFNTDSLPLGSKVDSVTTVISSTGTVYYEKRNKDGSSSELLWTAKDTLDLSRDVRLTVVSSDNSYRRQYTLKTNICTADPDSMKWSRMSCDIPDDVYEMKSVILNDKVTVLASMGETPLLLQHSVDGNDAWTDTPCSGLSADADISSLTLHDGILYVTDGGKLMKSSDGISWSEVSHNLPLLTLIPFRQTGDGGKAWAVTADGRIASSTDMREWNAVQDLPISFPDIDISALCYPVRSNISILRYIVTGIDIDLNPNNAEVWTRLSTEDSWTRIETSDGHSLRCPAFADLSVIKYDGDLFAFGHNGPIGNAETGSLLGFYQSSDNGLTWRDCNAFYDTFSTWNPYMEFPEELNGSDNPFCHVIDRHGDIWLITSGDGVWKGHINRLYKK